MRKTSLMLIKAFFPTFLLSILFFAFLLEFADLYVNLIKYIENKVSIIKVLYIQILYLPYCITKTLPIAILFASCFSLGNFYINNELIAVLTIGISTRRFVIPLVSLSFLFSIGVYYFKEYVEIQATKEHDRLKKNYLDYSDKSNSNHDFLISDKNFKVVYDVAYYDEIKGVKTLYNTTVIIRDKNKNFVKKIYFQKAIWNYGRQIWDLQDSEIYYYNNNKMIKSQYKERYFDSMINDLPKNFKPLHKNLEKETKSEALAIINSLKNSGLSYKLELTEYYSRYTFSFTSLIVTLIAVGIGPLFKKNILLLSLFFSIIIAVIYYVVNMVFIINAGKGLIHPILGASGAMIVFFSIAMILLLITKT